MGASRPSDEAPSAAHGKQEMSGVAELQEARQTEGAQDSREKTVSLEQGEGLQQGQEKRPVQEGRAGQGQVQAEVEEGGGSVVELECNCMRFLRDEGSDFYARSCHRGSPRSNRCSSSARCFRP